VAVGRTFLSNWSFRSRVLNRMRLFAPLCLFFSRVPPPPRIELPPFFLGLFYSRDFRTGLQPLEQNYFFLSLVLRELRALMAPGGDAFLSQITPSALLFSSISAAPRKKFLLLAMAGEKMKRTPQFCYYSLFPKKPPPPPYEGPFVVFFPRTFSET